MLKVIDSGVSSGKLSASDTFVADAKTQASGRLAADKASLAAYEQDARKASASESTISGAADALLSYDKAADAAELYQIALGKPGVDTARTLTRLGIAQFDQGKYGEAQATFAKVTGPRSSHSQTVGCLCSGQGQSGTCCRRTGGRTGGINAAPSSKEGRQRWRPFLLASKP